MWEGSAREPGEYMFRLQGERERKRLPPGRGENAPVVRHGAPVDGWRLLRVLIRYRVLLVGITVIAALVGVVTGKWLIVKTYAARAVLLWEPPAAARAHAAREISTLVDSVKLPSNLLKMRDKLGFQGTLERFAQQIDVDSGDNSSLLTITARARSRQEAADLANEAVSVFLESQKRASEVRLEQTAKTLRASLEQSQRATEKARQQYDLFRKENRIGDLSLEVQSAIEEVARLRVAANDARVELQSTGAEEHALRQKRSSLAAVVTAPDQDQQRAEAARLGQVEADLAGARSKYTDEHPRVKLLSGEAARLRARVDDPSSQPAKLSLRNPALLTVGSRLEQTSLARRTAEQRRIALTTVIEEAEQHAANLTAVQGQAARLLADVTGAQDHASAVLKELASAEDDVRSASSHFQIVSQGTAADHSEKGVGRIVAVTAPLGAFLLTLLVLLRREAGDLAVRTATEVAYWAGAPVLWSTGWPKGSEEELRELGRQMANILEMRPAVVGVTVLGRPDDQALPALLAAVSLERLTNRGETCEVTDLRNCLVQSTGDLADAMEHRSVGDELCALRSTTNTVLAVLPSLDDLAAVRASLRWIDALVVVVPSGGVRFTKLKALRQTLGLNEHGLGLVLVGMPQDLLHATARTANAAQGFWPSARRNRRSGVMHARLTQGTSSALVAYQRAPPR
jgi:uncharacterized protein involved in exopolysaccharide biosynthesis